MRTILVRLVALPLALPLAACGSPAPWENQQIVFAIEQANDEAGEAATLAGYEMLELRHRGWHARAFLDRTATCFVERLDDRLGKLRVEGGVATFRGGLLPPDGLSILANAEDARRPGRAWEDGHVLSFEATGFAAPRVDRFEMTAPAALDVVAPATGAIEVDPHRDFGLAWNPASGVDVRGERVLVALALPEESHRGVEARCFFDRAAGQGTVDPRVLEELGRSAGGVRTGRLQVATHRQVTVYAVDGWIQYVVATRPVREQPFTLAP